ncbi:MAG TPA: hypothetical protein VFM29_04690 [Vicinamibacteria bacterium]|nr:hypothetical protein [Vicinamibacteria bacterium]
MATAQPAPDAPPAAAPAVAPTPEPWPDAATLRERRLKAEALPLFASEEPLALTLQADFKQVNQNRDRVKKQRFAATLTVKGGDGAPRSIPVTLTTRGKFRLMARNCDFVPLRVELPKEAAAVAGTPFEGQSSLKLVTHCQDSGEYEQYMYREYLAYRIYNTLTPRSFRARLADVTYFDTTKGKAVDVRPGIFLETERDVARRLEGRKLERKGKVFAQLDAETLDTMMLFEFLIGNTDFSVMALHNVILVEDPQRRVYPVPYDFNHSGLVNARYAIPSPKLRIKTVVERLYRGPCRSPEQLGPAILHFRDKEKPILSLLDGLPAMAKTDRHQVESYLEEFFDTLRRPGSVKRHFTEGCPKGGGV